jgi:hypothetical protein
MQLAKLWNRAVTWNALVPTTSVNLGHPGATQGTSGHRLDIMLRHMGTTALVYVPNGSQETLHCEIRGCAEAYDPRNRLLVRQATRRRTPNARLRFRPPF